MTFTPALAAKIAEVSAEAVDAQVNGLTNLSPRKYNQLVSLGAARKAIELKDFAAAAKRLISNGHVAKTDPDEIEQIQRDVKLVNEYGQEMATDIQFAAQDASTVGHWRKAKVVYAIDGALLDELGETSDDTMVPDRLWERLGYPDPFVALPEPFTLPVPDGDLVQYVDGFWINGSWEVAPGRFIHQSTHSPKAGKYVSVLIHGRMMHADGRPVRSPDGRQDVNWTRLTLGTGRTVGQIITESMGRFVNNTDDDGVWVTDVPMLIRKLVSILVYLCSANADTEKMPRPPAKVRARGGKPYRAPQVIATGFRVGAALRQYRATASGGERGPATGRTVAPHIRRAHFHTFRVGPGRAEFEVRWLSPVLVKMGAADKPSVHEVKRSKRRV